LTSAEVDAKFLSLAEPLGGRELAQRLLALLREVETQADFGSVWGPLWAWLRRGAGASLA
jgi:hypothetical protein